MAEKEVDVVVRKDGEVVVASCAGLSILFIYPPKTNREEREIEREKEEKKKDGERREEDQRSAGDGWSDTDREREHQVRTGQE